MAAEVFMKSIKNIPVTLLMFFMFLTKFIVICSLLQIFNLNGELTHFNRYDYSIYC